MIEFGFQPWPMPAPFHGPVGLEVQFEEFVVPTDPDVMIQRETTGRVRVILTGDGLSMRPYMDAIARIWELQAD